MTLEDAPLVEIASAHCVECGEEVAAAEFSGGEAETWPVILEGAAMQRLRTHRVCGGHLELVGVRPAWHFCDGNCECGMGGLPDRVE